MLHTTVTGTTFIPETAAVQITRHLYVEVDKYQYNHRYAIIILFWLYSSIYIALLYNQNKIMIA